MKSLERTVDIHYHAIQRQPYKRQIWEVASLFAETQGRPEQYYYLVGETGLLDPVTGRYIHEFMENGTEIGQREFEAFREIEASICALSINDRAHWPQWQAVWVSPAHPERSENTKIIFHDIGMNDGNMQMRNICLLLDANPENVRDIANLLRKMQGLAHLEDIDLEDTRTHPFIYPFGVNRDILYQEILQIVHSNGLRELQSHGAQIAQNEAIKWARRYLRQKTSQSPMRYQHQTPIHFSPSCPPLVMSVASDVITRNGETWKFVKKCGACSAEINKFIPKGYRCIHCQNIYLGC